MNCEDLPGRLRDICDGTARKKTGEPFTDEERQSIVSRRMQTGALESVGSQAQSENPKKRGCGCGKKK